MDEYAFYLRKSRTDMEMEALGEGETLARHQHMLEALAARNEIHPSQITVYKELVSGDSISERPEMQRLLTDVHRSKYKGVLVVEVERLARGNTKDQGEVAEAFQASNTKIITPAKVYDPNNEFDQEYFEFGLFMSRREYKTIKRRLEAGKKQSVMEGNYLLPQRVFGYDIVRQSKKERTLVIREDEAKIVRLIFDWYTEDKQSTGRIARQLTLMGVQTVKRRPEWNRGTIQAMLTNPIYIGKVTWNGSKTVKKYDPKTGTLKKTVQHNLEPEIYEGKQEGIISEEQFYKACEMAKSSNSAPAKAEKELVNPLAGLLQCASCGRALVSMRYNDGRTTRMSHARDTICTKKSLPMDLVIEALCDTLKDMIADCEIKAKQEGNQEEFKKHELLIDTMERELEKLERKRKKLFADYEDETYTRDEFIERKQHYNREIDKLKKQLQETRNSAPVPVDYSEQISNLHSVIDSLNNPDLPAKAKNDCLKQFISKITYDAIDYGPKKGGKPILEVFLK